MLTTVLTFFNCLWVLTENTLNFSDRIPVAFKGCQKYCRPKDSPKSWFMCRDRVKNCGSREVGIFHLMMEINIPVKVMIINEQLLKQHPI